MSDAPEETPAPAEAPHLDPRYQWPASSASASHADIAAAIGHVKAWVARELGLTTAPPAETPAADPDQD